MQNSKEAQPKPKLIPAKIRKVIEDPRRVAREMAVFRVRAKSYDPMPDKILILGKQTPIRVSA